MKRPTEEIEYLDTALSPLMVGKAKLAIVKEYISNLESQLNQQPQTGGEMPELIDGDIVTDMHGERFFKFKNSFIDEDGIGSLIDGILEVDRAGKLIWQRKQVISTKRAWELAVEGHDVYSIQEKYEVRD